MERLNWHMAAELSNEYSVRLIAPRGTKACGPDGVTVDEVALRPLWRFLLGAALSGFFIALRWKPDIVLAGSGLTAPMAWLAARLCGARTVVYLHGLDISAPHPLYRRFWLPAIRSMDLVVVNSSATRLLAIENGVSEPRIRLIHPGVALPKQNQTSVAITGDEFRRTHNLGAGPILLSVGRLTTRKGMLEFVSDVLPLVAAACPSVQLVIIGDKANSALAANSQSPESIRAGAEARGLGSQVHFLGGVPDVLLAAAFEAADVHVFPVREIPGDPEGFGMVAIEAAAHGVPTASYASGGVVDAVADGVSGYLAPPGDGSALARNILKLLNQHLPKSQVQNFAGQFAWEYFGVKLRDALVQK